MQKYRELEQARFVYFVGSHFNPILLDNFLAVIDAIFDVRAPPLMLILSRFEEVANNVIVPSEDDDAAQAEIENSPL